MRFQDVAPSLVQPGNHDEFIAHLDPLKPLCTRRMHFEPCVGRASAALVGCCSTIFERRAKEAKWNKGIVSLLHDVPSRINVNRIIGIHDQKKASWILPQ